jgi:predicted RNA-binding Zn-ribbon protein involved in translation (DUF1610 family)
MNRVKFFIYSSAAIMLAAALERFIVAAGNAEILSAPELVLGIPIRSVTLAVGAAEMLVALICFFGKNTHLQTSWLAWMCFNYWVYRIGLFVMHRHPQTTGIGRLTDPLHLANGGPGILTMVAPVYLLLGSLIAWLWLWSNQRRYRREMTATESVKMACPACGVHIRFDVRNLGQKIPCPQCQKTITLRKPDLLKMSCFFCKEHIEYPPHAIGEKMSCPHCQMNITLKEPA